MRVDDGPHVRAVPVDDAVHRVLLGGLALALDDIAFEVADDHFLRADHPFVAAGRREQDVLVVDADADVAVARAHKVPLIQQMTDFLKLLFFHLIHGG